MSKSFFIVFRAWTFPSLQLKIVEHLMWLFTNNNTYITNEHDPPIWTHICIMEVLQAYIMHQYLHNTHTQCGAMLRVYI